MELVDSRYTEMRYQMPHIVTEGDTVAVYLRAFFKKRGNGRVVQFDMAVFYSFRGGLVSQIREIIDSCRPGAAGARTRDRSADRRRAGRG